MTHNLYLLLSCSTDLRFSSLISGWQVPEFFYRHWAQTKSAKSLKKDSTVRTETDTELILRKAWRFRSHKSRVNRWLDGCGTGQRFHQKCATGKIRKMEDEEHSTYKKMVTKLLREYVQGSNFWIIGLFILYQKLFFKLKNFRNSFIL